MQNKIKISIIIPVYNVREYLEKAVSSIIQSEFQDFEIFLVDDGSTDGSSEICDKLLKNDNRINVIHQKNSGAYAARNVAIKKISGEYVCFFDADDYIDKNMLLDLYNIAKINDSDLVVGGFYIDTYYSEEKYIELEYLPDVNDNYVYTLNDRKLVCEIIDDENIFRKNAYKNFDKNMFYPPWNKLYKREFLINNNILFPETYRDDFPFVISYIKNIKKITYVKRAYYHFLRKRSESETQKYVKNLYEKREEEHKLMCDLYAYWNLSEDMNSLEMINRRYIDRVIECVVNLFNNNANNEKKEIIDQIQNMLNSENLNKARLYAKPKKLYLKLMYIPLKIKNVFLCIIMAKFINFVKNRNIKLFSLLKTNR